MEEEFANSQIDDHFYEDSQKINATELEVLHLKDNVIPRGLVPLEELLTCNIFPYVQICHICRFFLHLIVTQKCYSLCYLLHEAF